MPRSPTTSSAVHIPEGDYFTLAAVSDRFDVTHRTVQQWLDKGWLSSIHVPGLGHLIRAADLEAFTPPKPGRHGG